MLNKPTALFFSFDFTQVGVHKKQMKQVFLTSDLDNDKSRDTSWGHWGNKGQRFNEPLAPSTCKMAQGSR